MKFNIISSIFCLLLFTACSDDDNSRGGDNNKALSSPESYTVTSENNTAKTFMKFTIINNGFRSSTHIELQRMEPLLDTEKSILEMFHLNPQAIYNSFFSKTLILDQKKYYDDKFTLKGGISEFDMCSETLEFAIDHNERGRHFDRVGIKYCLAGKMRKLTNNMTGKLYAVGSLYEEGKTYSIGSESLILNNFKLDLLKPFFHQYLGRWSRKPSYFAGKDLMAKSFAGLDLQLSKGKATVTPLFFSSSLKGVELKQQTHLFLNGESLQLKSNTEQHNISIQEDDYPVIELNFINSENEPRYKINAVLKSLENFDISISKMNHQSWELIREVQFEKNN